MKSLWVRIINYLTDNMFITNFLMVIILVLGFIIGSNMRREVAPTVEADAIHINIYSPTSSAQEIEQDIIIPLEKAVQGFDVSLRYSSFANDAWPLVVTLVSQLLNGLLEPLL